MTFYNVNENVCYSKILKINTVEPQAPWKLKWGHSCTRTLKISQTVLDNINSPLKWGHPCNQDSFTWCTEYGGSTVFILSSSSGFCSPSFCWIGKTESRQSLIRGLEKMKEKDLLELLSQYESDERFGGLPTTSQSLSVSCGFFTLL